MGNDMWHVALEPGKTSMQDVILVEIDADDLETIGYLLSTSIVKSQVLETERGSYLLMCDGKHERPYPSVMIWRVGITEEKSTVVDMRYEDSWIVEHVWRKWLMPEEIDAEYVPPKRFIVMTKP